MDDFSGAAVKMFLESLYTGEVEPNKELFRDVNKMANVFNVSWLTSKCENYFCDLVQNAGTRTMIACFLSSKKQDF